MPPLNEALNQAGGALAGDLLPANTALPKVQANVAWWEDPRLLQALADEVVALMKQELKLERQRLGRYRY